MFMISVTAEGAHHSCNSLVMLTGYTRHKTWIVLYTLYQGSYIFMRSVVYTSVRTYRSLIVGPMNL